MEVDLANLNLDDPVAGQEEDDVGEDDFRFCLVGRVLTDSSVHFPSLRNVLLELWYPIEGGMVKVFALFDYRWVFKELSLDGISLRAGTRRETMAVSRWHREEPKDIIKSDMDLEEACRRNQMWFNGIEDVTPFTRHHHRIRVTRCYDMSTVHNK
ncbi:hypothetical protein Golax_019509 [Gossypium laxum]|uniref:Uncharacterized protein n=1 Tax=Gossypium laxum TaxID=34288 RepID=A0A7J8Z6V2_9ROSI|nr:hypothetical protein [Gossypium laxum]